MNLEDRVHLTGYPTPIQTDSGRHIATSGGGGISPAVGAQDWMEDAIIVECADGKTRRIPAEPRLRPLAHGVSARVVRLRGYGNAIVPQVGGVFLRAVLEIVRERRGLPA